MHGALPEQRHGRFNGRRIAASAEGTRPARRISERCHVALGSRGLNRSRGRAAAAAGANTITFSSLFDNPQTITLTSGDLVITNSVNSNVTINGPGANLLTVSGNNNSKIFSILETPVVSISGMKLISGNGVGSSPGNTFGGAIYNQGETTLTNMIISGNSATTDGGGAQAGSTASPPA